jgi:hypothetical protein
MASIWQRPSFNAVYANVRRQKSMCLRMRDAPTCIGYRQYFAIEEGACLVGSQVSDVVLERMKI